MPPPERVGPGPRSGVRKSKKLADAAREAQSDPSEVSHRMLRVLQTARLHECASTVAECRLESATLATLAALEAAPARPRASQMVAFPEPHKWWACGAPVRLDAAAESAPHTIPKP